MYSFIDRHSFHGLARWAVLAAFASSVPIAQAQSATGTTVPATGGAESQSTPRPPLLQYRSVFAQYQGFTEQPVNPWIETNATVEKIGGWRVYAKEARQADMPEKSPAASEGSGSHIDHGRKP